MPGSPIVFPVILSFQVQSVIPGRRNSPNKKGAPHSVARHALPYFLLRSPDVTFQRFGDHLFRHRSHNLLDDLPVLEQQQRRYSLNAIAPR